MYREERKRPERIEFAAQRYLKRRLNWRPLPLRGDELADQPLTLPMQPITAAYVLPERDASASSSTSVVKRRRKISGNQSWWLDGSWILQRDARGHKKLSIN